MEAESWIRIGGVYHLGCAVLHVFFPKALRWEEDLASVSSVNRAVYWILSKLLMYAYAALGIGSIAFASELVSGGAGNFILVSVSGFWLVRAAFQVKFLSVFDEYTGGRRNNLLMLLLWLLGAILYGIPLLLTA